MLTVRSLASARLLATLIRRQAASAPVTASNERTSVIRKEPREGRNLDGVRSAVQRHRQMKQPEESASPGTAEASQKRKLTFKTAYDIVRFYEVNGMSGMDTMAAARGVAQDPESDLHTLTDRQMSVLIHGYDDDYAHTVPRNVRKLALEDFVENCQKRGIKFDVFAKNAILKARINNGTELKAADVLQEWEKEELTPNQETYELVARIYAQQADTKAILAIMQHMKEASLSLSERVVGPLVHSVARQGNYGQAEDIIKKFIPGLPEVALRYYLANAALQNGDIHEAVNAIAGTTASGNIFGFRQQEKIIKLFIDMVEKNMENPFELLAPYLVTSPDGRTLNTENAPNGKLVTAVRLAAAEGRVKDAIRLFERVPFSQRKTNHRREMRNGLVKMIESENTSVEELIEISERIRNNWMLPGTEGDAMGIVLEELGKCESIDRVAAVFDALKHKDYFYDLLQTNPNCKRPLALSIAKQIPKAKSPEERDKRIADVATVLFVAPEEEVRAVEEYRQIIYRLCDNDVALAIHVLPQIEDSIVAREFATSIVSQILRNYPDDKLAVDKLEKFLDSNTIDDLLGVAFMTQLQHFLANKSDDSDNKRKVNIAAKIIALSFPSDPSLPSHSGAVILEFIYCSYALPLSAIQTITEHLQNEPRVNLTFDQMNHIKEKLAKLKMEERTEFVEVLKKQSKTVQRWQNSSLQELEAELDKLMEKEGSTWVVMAAVLCREIVNKVGNQIPMNVSDAIRILEDIQIRRGKMKELMGEMEGADRKRAETVMRTVLDKAYNRLANAAFTRAGNEDGLEQLDKLWNLGIGSSLGADNLLFYISRLYLGGRLENAGAVGEVLRETGQSVVGDTFEKLGRRLALFDIAKIDSLTSYLSDTFGFPHNSVLRLKANIVQNEIKALIKSDKAEEAFELCKKLALQNHKTVGQFELMNEALRTENRELLEKVVQLVASQNGQSAAVYDMIYSILDCRLIDKWKDRIKNLIERQPNEIDSRMMGYFVGKASGDKRPDILRNIFELMREKVSIVDMNNVLETLIKLYYRSNDFESIKSLEEEIRKTNYPLKNNTEKWLAKMHKKS